jgi:hypothetical protein
LDEPAGLVIHVLAALQHLQKYPEIVDVLTEIEISGTPDRGFAHESKRLLRRGIVAVLHSLIAVLHSRDPSWTAALARLRARFSPPSRACRLASISCSPSRRTVVRRAIDGLCIQPPQDVATTVLAAARSPDREVLAQR